MSSHSFTMTCGQAEQCVMLTLECKTVLSVFFNTQGVCRLTPCSLRKPCLVLEVLHVAVQGAQLVALALARGALLAQLLFLLAQRGLLLPDHRALLAHLLPRLQHAHLQLCALALRVLHRVENSLRYVRKAALHSQSQI